MLKKALFLFIIILSCSCAINAQNPFSGTDLKTINVDAYSDQQISQALEEIKKEGFTLPQVEQIAKQKGLPNSEWQKFLARAQTLKKGTKDNIGAVPIKVVDTVLTKDRTIANPTEDSKQMITSNSVVVGAELFKNKNLTFEPNLRIPTPKTYTLGPDDELIIDIYGDAESSYTLKVSADGYIRIPLLGPVSVSGLTIEQAKRRITDRLRQGYSSLGGATQVQVTLGQIRSIKITIIGESTLSGTYTLPSLATLFNALYVSGGPSENGSFRNIELLRNNKLIQKVDLYKFLLYGDQKGDVRLEDQDVIRIPTYSSRVKVDGFVKRPGVYEMLAGDKLRDVIAYAGGFSDKAYTDQVKVVHITNKDQQIIDVPSSDYSKFIVSNADQITVSSLLNRFGNRVQIQGAIFRPGPYSLDGIRTMKQLIERADGLKEDAFLPRAILYRKKEDLTKQIVSFDLGKLVSGEAKDISLQKEDSVIIYSKFQLKESYTISIQGQVSNPGKFEYFEGISVEDVIQLAGGLKEDASVDKVEIARRVSDSDPNDQNRVLSKVYELNIGRNLDLRSDLSEFSLQPFDEITVRTSPNYKTQQFVSINGEVQYVGRYVIDNKSIRVSDVLKRAGGLTVDAYSKGAILLRKTSVNSIESKIRAEQLQAIQKLDTNVNTNLSLTNDREFITIDLDYILKHPGSTKDIILEDEDLLNIPRCSNVIKTKGEVVYPQAIAFVEGKSAKRYIRQSGGFGDAAFKRRTYVAYQNGRVKGTRSFVLWRSFPKVYAGSVIFVPKRLEETGKKITPAELTAIAAIVSSITTSLFIAYSVINK